MSGSLVFIKTIADSKVGIPVRAEIEAEFCYLSRYILKSDNLRYNTLGRWNDRLINQAWTIRRLVNETIDQAYYIEDCRIFKDLT